jgi:hypothetical protein
MKSIVLPFILHAIDHAIIINDNKKYNDMYLFSLLVKF